MSRLLVKAYSNCNCCSTLSTNRLSTQFRDNVDSVVYVSDSSSECYSRQYDGRRTTQKRNQHTPPEKETQYLYDVRIKACIKRYDRGSYSYSKLQFLREFSHSLGMHTESFHVTSDVSDDNTLVPCGHSRFCESCADAVAAMDNGCPLCRTPITMVLRLYD